RSRCRILGFCAALLRAPRRCSSCDDTSALSPFGRPGATILAACRDAGGRLTATDVVLGHKRPPDMKKAPVGPAPSYGVPPPTRGRGKGSSYCRRRLSAAKPI